MFRERENSESKVFIKKLDFSLSSLNWEQLSFHSPTAPENVCLCKVRLHLLLGHEHLSAVEPITVYSGAKTTTGDTDR